MEILPRLSSYESSYKEKNCNTLFIDQKTGLSRKTAWDLKISQDMSGTKINLAGEKQTEPVLQIHLLGPPLIKWQGELLSIPRRNVRCLFYRLAAALCDPGQMLSREQLYFLFWPDSSDKVASRNLSHLLTHLRRALPDSNLVQSMDRNLFLKPDKIWADILLLDRISNLETNSLSEITEAVNHYRGPFLHGCSLPKSREYDAWVTTERVIFEQNYLALLSLQIDLYFKNAEFESAILAAQQYLDTDNLAEQIHRKLIELYLKIGDAAAAQQQLETCVATLERELGVSPMPETWAAIRTKRFFVPPMMDVQEKVPAQLVALSKSLPFVNREAELHQLNRELHKTYQDQSRFVLVCGERGVGKSRLIRMFMDHYQGSAILMEGSCNRSASSLPYQPLAESLRSTLGRILSSSIDPSWLSEASRVLPELRSRLPELPEPLSRGTEEARTRLFEALCQLIAGISTPQTAIILFLDDLQWADITTLEWLGFLFNWLQKAGRGGILVLGTCRELEKKHYQLSILREELTRLQALFQLNLQALSITDFQEVIQRIMIPEAPTNSLLERLHQVTGGNPFYLTEILRHFLKTHGYIPHDSTELDETPLPDTIRQAIRHRISSITPLEKQVLEAAAILERISNLDLLRHTSGRNEFETLKSIETLTNLHLLEKLETHYRFHHELVQTTLVNDLSLWRKQLLHRRAAEALQKIQPETVSSISRHFEQGGQDLKAAVYAIQLGSNASQVFAYPEALSAYDRALMLLQRGAESLTKEKQINENRYLQVKVRTARSWLNRLLGDFDAYQRDLKGLTHLAQSLDDHQILADVLASKSYLHRQRGQLDKALDSGYESLALAKKTGSRYLSGRANREIGIALRAQGQLQSAMQALEQAYQIFVEVDNPVLQVHTLCNLSTLAIFQEDYQGAKEFAERSLERCEELRYQFLRRIPLGDLGVALACLGDEKQGRDYLQQSLALSRKIDDSTQVIFCLDQLGLQAIRENQPIKALDLLQEALTLAESNKFRLHLSHIHSVLAEAYSLSGDIKAAKIHANQANEIAEQIGQTHEQQTSRRILLKLGKENL